MKALGPLALGSLLLVSACKVEPTPAEYIDLVSSTQGEREAASSEVRDRVLATGQALSRRNASDALLALAPAQDVYLAGPEPGAEASGVEGVGGVLAGLASLPLPLATAEVVVTVATGGDVVWFRALLAPTGEENGAAALRMTGIYRLNEGLWQLALAHLSPATPLPPSPEGSAGDSAAAE